MENALLGYMSPLLSLTLRPSKYQKTSARLLTHIHFLLAVITKHHLNFVARELHCLQAIQSSRIAEDTTLEAASLMYLAYTYIYCSPLRPKEAIKTFLSALHLLGKETSLLHSDIYIGLANAYALCREEKKSLETIALAYTSLPKQPEQDESFLYAGCSTQVVHQYEGKMYLSLAKNHMKGSLYQRAEKIFTQTMAMDTISERSTNETYLYQAEVACGLENLDVYVDYITKAVKTSRELNSRQRYQQACKIHQHIPEKWNQEHVIQGITQEFFVKEEGVTKHE